MYPLERDSLAYPEVVKIKVDGAEKPTLFTIGDSYFWPIYHKYPIHNHLFNNQSFWYYYYLSFHPESSKTDLVTQLAKSDLLLFVSSTSILSSFGWGGVDAIWKYFQNNPDKKPFAKEIEAHHKMFMEESYELMVERYKQEINESEEKRAYIDNKAKKQGLSYDEMLDMDARWLADQELNNIEQQKQRQKLEDMMQKIRNTPDWFKKIEQKAKKNGISVDSMLLIDAQWILDNP